jgi:1,2-phenylacetyl-CoA epoxidase catalytic subunit
MQLTNDKMQKKYHQAVESWQERWFPEHTILDKYWSKYFPNHHEFCLCAAHDLDTVAEIELGEKKGEKKYESIQQMTDDEAAKILKIIRAQASTELGSIQQHRETLDKAWDEETRFDILRVMAEELRHAYQMLHILTEDDRFTEDEKDEMVEEALQAETGQHILDAFNIHYDTYVDNVAFTMIIDRVGKYQLTMQKVCAYRPMSSSMPYMLQEEAFHLASGVKPYRKWATAAGMGESPYSMHNLQTYINKWCPRAYEMFGDERGGGSNVKYGFKDMKNEEAQLMYIEEMKGVVDDVDRCYIQAKFPEDNLDVRQATEIARKIRTQGVDYKGVGQQDLLYVPDRRYFRRRGPLAFMLIGADGTEYSTYEAYKEHLEATLPSEYFENDDFKMYDQKLKKVCAGEITAEDAAMDMPQLARDGYCPCSKSVRYVVKEGAESTN